MTDLPTLAPHLAERTRPLNRESIRSDRAFVLYWLRTAIRADENPALDVAVTIGNRLGRPVLVYQALSERYPFASDRHHTFVLEGTADLAPTLAARGIAHAFHLERPGQRGPHLRDLAARAAVVVTEDMPVDPARAWTETLAATIDAAAIAVDTACVVPMRLVGKAHDRAFAFRRATRDLRAERLHMAWPAVEPAMPPLALADLPFEPVDLGAGAIPDLVAACEIDHSVAPVPDTRGGSTAGYGRWQAFRDQRLAAYADRRNDALQPDAVSRLSAYLHYGMVSPFRIAREAAEVGGRGAEKFLDELLVWRELSYAWCHHRPDHDRWDALPGWARETLTAHAADRRPAIRSWEALARARSGDPLWDAAQRSLLIHGELHNNVRMTWGKAILEWTDGPERALDLMVDLNHRYALDGRDPNSYGGLFWCLGLFDRPFAPERPVFGAVRGRSTRDHARRLDVEAYGRLAARPARADPPTVAVIGAGVAGLACARTLADHGYPVTVFDKARGPGGRLATRRADPFRFDHGAQYLTIRDRRLRPRVESWVHDGVVAPWDARVVRWQDGALVPEPARTDRLVGVPGMNALAQHLAADLDVRPGRRVAGLSRHLGWWLALEDGARDGPFDLVIVAVPAPQAVPLLAAAPDLAAAAEAAVMHPCWATMLAFEAPTGIDFDAAFLGPGPLGWVARDGAKPGRLGETWVLHATHDWSVRELERDPADAAAILTEAFRAVTGTAAKPVHITGHRWRYAFVDRPVGSDCLFDAAAGLGACGDWCLGARVEAALLSGYAMAGRVLGLDITALGRWPEGDGQAP